MQPVTKGIGKVIPGTHLNSHALNSIENQGYSSNQFGPRKNAADIMSNGTMSNQGSFYSNMGMAP